MWLHSVVACLYLEGGILVNGVIFRHRTGGGSITGWSLTLITKAGGLP